MTQLKVGEVETKDLLISPELRPGAGFFEFATESARGRVLSRFARGGELC
ncbi:MAG: hypothetical protein HC941_32240 [Microcoleus sp. SU_5_3]|nr:hypothetical protein [Microcoleus sp. SU_5_3]